MKVLGILLLSIVCLCAKEVVVDGYVEGEYVYLAPSTSGILEEINVVKGQQVTKDSNLFAVDSTMWQLKLNNAQKASKQQKSNSKQSLVMPKKNTITLENSYNPKQFHKENTIQNLQILIAQMQESPS